jgi:hypothetical protein
MNALTLVSPVPGALEAARRLSDFYDRMIEERAEIEAHVAEMERRWARNRILYFQRKDQQ